MTDTTIRQCLNHDSALIVIDLSDGVLLELPGCVNAGEHSQGEGAYSHTWYTDRVEVK